MKKLTVLSRAGFMPGVFLLTVFLLVGGVLPVHAGSGDEGSSGGVFLKIDPDAKSAAYGSASLGRSSHGNAIHHNPAGLAYMRHSETKFTQFNMIADINYNNLSLSVPVSRNWGGLGLGATFLDFGDQDRTTINTSDNPQQDGTFGADDLAISGSYGLPITDHIGFGVTYKYIRQNIAEFESTTQAFDAGFKIKSGVEGLNFGLAARNLGGDVEFLEESDPLATTYGAGFNYTTPSRWGADRLSLGADFIVSDDAEPHLAGGIEYEIEEMVALRAGYNGGPDVGDGLTLGGGLQLGSFTVDYAFVSMGDLGDNQRFTLAYEFGHWQEPMDDEAQPILRDREDLYGGIITPPLNPSSVREEEFIRPEELYEWKVALDIGKHAYLNGDYERARAQFIKVHRLRPNFVTNLIWLGLAEYKLGQVESAKERFYRALELEPNNGVARRNLERISD